MSSSKSKGFGSGKTGFGGGKSANGSTEVPYTNPHNNPIEGVGESLVIWKRI